MWEPITIEEIINMITEAEQRLPDELNVFGNSSGSNRRNGRKSGMVTQAVVLG